ncbi:hypothetical protein A6302_03179 [Methylobrevis pamukkalensis]|uniref:Uncharacterized protein n=1 Tax=Methylobrevis pamukkalensis TaxID=1439726 RepID=A0A1E3GZL6_9HYPH|nr:hypothetical protein A6302_03179 [Methylobrevis pamukkalensis]
MMTPKDKRMLRLFALSLSAAGLLVAMIGATLEANAG